MSSEFFQSYLEYKVEDEKIQITFNNGSELLKISPNMIKQSINKRILEDRRNLHSPINDISKPPIVTQVKINKNNITLFFHNEDFAKLFTGYLQTNPFFPQKSKVLNFLETPDFFKSDLLYSYFGFYLSHRMSNNLSLLMKGADIQDDLLEYLRNDNKYLKDREKFIEILTNNNISYIDREGDKLFYLDEVIQFFKSDFINSNRRWFNSQDIEYYRIFNEEESLFQGVKDYKSFEDLIKKFPSHKHVILQAQRRIRYIYYLKSRIQNIVKHGIIVHSKDSLDFLSNLFENFCSIVISFFNSLWILYYNLKNIDLKKFNFNNSFERYKNLTKRPDFSGEKITFFILTAIRTKFIHPDAKSYVNITYSLVEDIFPLINLNIDNINLETIPFLNKDLESIKSFLTNDVILKRFELDKNDIPVNKNFYMTPPQTETSQGLNWRVLLNKDKDENVKILKIESEGTFGQFIEYYMQFLWDFGSTILNNI